MKTSIRALAMGVALARPTTAYANENRNIIEELFFGSASPQRDAGGDFVLAAPRPNHEGFTQQYFRLSC
jgi:hypothetical protein